MFISQSLTEYICSVDLSHLKEVSPFLFSKISNCQCQLCIIYDVNQTSADLEKATKIWGSKDLRNSVALCYLKNKAIAWTLRNSIQKMCILFMYNGTHDARSDYSLVLVSNRDEYYNRATKNMAPWIEDPNVIGGRDLEVNEGGTWLAVAPTRKKLGVLLNLAGSNKPSAKSRGTIVAEYVKSEKPVTVYTQQIKKYSKDCNDFIFVSVEFRSAGPTITSFSNANDELTTHREAYVGFGNSLPEESFKKVEAGKNKLMQILTTFNKVSTQEELVEQLIELLRSEERHLPDHTLETKRPNLYKELSSIFVCIPQGKYGTRTHSIVLVTKTGHMKIIELTQEAPIDPLRPKWTRTEFEFDMDL